MRNEQRAPRARLQLGRYPQVSLVVFALAYLLLAFSLSSLRSQELYTGNWDLGIFQQAFWSSAHGHPFYEAGDYEMYGFGSLFQVHPAPLLIGLSALYNLFPQASTLFLLQATVVSLGAVPLYYLAKDVTGSDHRALLVAGLYLIWPPLLAANLYDFHLEAFLPVELFLLFLLWRRGRYGWGALAAFLAFVTIEAGPVFVASIALFFLLPPLVESYQRLGGRAGTAPPRGRWLSRFGLLGRDFLYGPRLRPARYAAILFLAACGAYLVLQILQGDPGLLLVPVVPLSTNPSRPVLNAGLYISASHLPVDLPQKFSYWLALYALVGFLPLRSLRAQILVLPWLGYTFVSYSEFTVFGNQYGFLPVVPLFVGLAYGLKDLDLLSLPDALRHWRKHERASPARKRPGSRQGPHALSRKGTSSPGERAAPATFLLFAVVVACLILSPADPLVQRTDLGNGYQVNYVPMVGSAQVTELARQIPANAVVLASNNLFPLVANDVHAYALLWTPTIPPYLPFNRSHLPAWVFLCSSQSFAVPAWLGPLLTNGTTYALRGQVFGTTQGTVSLFVQV